MRRGLVVSVKVAAATAFVSFGEATIAKRRVPLGGPCGAGLDKPEAGETGEGQGERKSIKNDREMPLKLI